MAWIRQLKSGLWAATVRTGPGPKDRITESDPSKTVISNWAKEQEIAIRRGDWIDPRLGRVTVAEWWPRALAGRGHLERASLLRDESVWRNHVEPAWGSTRLSTILKPDINAWVKEMNTSHKEGCKDRRCKGCRVGAHTIHAAVHVLRTLLEVAVDSRILHTNHCRNIRGLPRLPAHVDRVFEPGEERQLLERLDELFPGRVDARPFVELMFDSGVRWEEAAAITREVWDMKRGRFEVAAVLEADGSLRPYAKSDAGNRPCAVSSALWARLRPIVMATPPGEVVFRAPGVAHLDDCPRKRCPGCKVPRLHYSNWHRRVWTPALRLEEVLPPAPRPAGRPGPMPRRVVRVPYLPNPQPTPHDIRHTYGTRLADQGVPKHDISKLMGHADGRSTDRYVHSGDGRFDKALEALERARRGA